MYQRQGIKDRQSHQSDILPSRLRDDIGNKWILFAVELWSISGVKVFNEVWGSVFSLFFWFLTWAAPLRSLQAQVHLCWWLSCLSGDLLRAQTAALSKYEANFCFPSGDEMINIQQSHLQRAKPVCSSPPLSSFPLPCFSVLSSPLLS